MDGLRPTLPFLLDLNSAPSYHSPKQANQQPIRPATTNIARNPSNNTSSYQFKKSTKKDSLNQSKSPFKSTGPFYQNNSKKQAEVEDYQTFRFTEFQSLHKNLPRLYTPSQYDSASRKLNNLKERYQHLYVKPEGAEEEIVQEIVQDNLKEMVLEAEKVFNSTYSVKYFGVKDNTLGIVSKRVPMSNNTIKQQDKDKNTTLKPGTAGRKQRFYKDQNAQANRKQMMATTDPSRATQQSWGLGLWNESTNRVRDFTDNTQFHTDREAKMGVQANDAELSPIRAPRPETISLQASGEKARATPAASNKMRSSLPAKFEDAIDFKGESPEIKEEVAGEGNNGVEFNESYDYEQLAKASQDKLPTDTNLPGAAYVVTKYFVPKKLQSVKKKPEEDNKAVKINSKGFEVKGNISKRGKDVAQDRNIAFETADSQDKKDRIWQKVTVFDQTASSNADFERKLNSMGKVKRSLLRNVRVEKAWEARPYKDELDVQEKFRTHEVQKVMADNAKYSYAKLLETMQTSERPETALISNTEKMEKILSIRKEKRTILASRGTDTEEFDTVENEKRGTNGRYIVKVWYPKENEMFNRFVKIRANVDGMEQEVS